MDIRKPESYQKKLDLKLYQIPTILRYSDKTELDYESMWNTTNNIAILLAKLELQKYVLISWRLQLNLTQYTD